MMERLRQRVARKIGTEGKILCRREKISKVLKRLILLVIAVGDFSKRGPVLQRHYLDRHGYYSLRQSHSVRYDDVLLHKGRGLYVFVLEEESQTPLRKTYWHDQ